MAVPLYIALVLLIIDGVLESAFIGSFVTWDNKTAGAGFVVNYPNNEKFLMAGKPLNFLVDQGHTSHGAAGAAFIVTGLGGFIALALRHRQLRRSENVHGFTSFIYNFWLYFSAISAVFSLAAFVYVLVVTYQHDGQSIDLEFLSTLEKEPYPRMSWTPQNWLPAVLDLPLASQESHDSIETHLRLVRGWQWNLIPMTVLGFVVAVLAFVNDLRHKQRLNKYHAESRLEAARQKRGSPHS